MSSQKNDPVSMLIVDQVPDAPEGESTIITDRVITPLLADGRVTRDQIGQAWSIWNEKRSAGHRDPLWRCLLTLTDVDRDTILKSAAATYGFERTIISSAEASAFVRRIFPKFEPEAWLVMESSCVLPIGWERHPNGDAQRLVFATHDPARLDVHSMLSKLPVKHFVVKWAPERIVRYLISELIDNGELLPSISFGDGATDRPIFRDRTRINPVPIPIDRSKPRPQRPRRAA